MCRSAMNDGSCSPWVMCSCSVVSGNQIRDRAPPPKSGFQDASHTAQSRRAVERRWNGGPGPCGANETGANQGRAEETAET